MQISHSGAAARSCCCRRIRNPARKPSIYWSREALRVSLWCATLTSRRRQHRRYYRELPHQMRQPPKSLTSISSVPFISTTFNWSLLYLLTCTSRKTATAASMQSSLVQHAGAASSLWPVLQRLPEALKHVRSIHQAASSASPSSPKTVLDTNGGVSCAEKCSSGLPCGQREVQKPQNDALLSRILTGLEEFGATVGGLLQLRREPALPSPSRLHT